MENIPRMDPLLFMENIPRMAPLLLSIIWKLNGEQTSCNNKCKGSLRGNAYMWEFPLKRRQLILRDEAKIIL